MAALASLPVLVLALQAAGSPPSPAYPTTSNSVSTTRAALAAKPPVIDGRDDDEVWRLATPITGFRQFRPVEDGEPSFRTETKVAYDARNFYVFIRAFDPHPDSILKLLARRDVRTASDQLKIIIDSYHDRRTGYEFAVNPAGVKRDFAVYDDGNEDDAWDGVWEAGTQVDSLGWTAEFRIPLSQMRYAPGPTNTFGFGVWRDIDRYTERVSWPLYRVTRPGLMSQLGEVTGLDGLDAPRRIEITPYFVTKNVPENGFDRSQKLDAGADIKYGLTSNITIDATVNPDFGQVEADPSVLNLGPFETFYQERRPFFIEGTGIFQFGINCSVVNCSGEGLFYSRRVGGASRILGAAKITGRLPSGLTLGIVDAVTNDVTIDTTTLEPTTNYGGLRLTQDFRKGESGIGIMLTAVNRGVDRFTDTLMRKSAYVGAFNFRHRFKGGRYQLTGSIDASRIAGTPAAIARAQRSSVHLYQRPDDALALDTTRTTLTGDAEEILFGKTGGFVRFETSYQRRSAGFDVNDFGFLRRADQQSWNNWAAMNWTKPFLIFQQGFWNFNWWQFWTTEGMPTERAANTNAHFQLNNRYWLHLGGTVGQLGTTFDDRVARGGPAVRQDSYIAPWFGFEGDQRRPVIPYLFFNLFRGSGGRSTSFNVSPSFDLRVSTQFRASFGLSFSHDINDWQFVGTDTTGGTTHYLFAHLDQKTASMSFRLDYTASPTLTVQAYASPFVSKGPYSNVRELANPRADRYADRFQSFAATPGFENFKAFNSNLVLRWEYRPGSTLFVVWSQGRVDASDVDVTRPMPRDFRRLFNQHPENTFLVKMSYWLSR
jgi:uncharacterized protein DUF5916/cellulose/xylan binding protein with CBM9 domain